MKPTPIVLAACVVAACSAGQSEALSNGGIPDCLRQLAEACDDPAVGTRSYGFYTNIDIESDSRHCLNQPAGPLKVDISVPYQALNLIQAPNGRGRRQSMGRVNVDDPRFNAYERYILSHMPTSWTTESTSSPGVFSGCAEGCAVAFAWRSYAVLVTWDQARVRANPDEVAANIYERLNARARTCATR